MTFLTAPQLEALSENLEKNFKSQNEYRRRRTICFVRIDNESGVLQYVFWGNEKKVWCQNKARTSRMINGRNNKCDVLFVKTTADERQFYPRVSKPPQTCDKKKWISRGEFLVTTKSLK